MKYIKFFDEITQKDLPLTGGKGTSLGMMYNAGLPVPPGFVITTNATDKFSEQGISDDCKNEIMQAFEKLGSDHVAVRSSALSEDSLEASWAGQLDTFLNIPLDNLFNKIEKCWDSIHSERAFAYMQKQSGTNHKLQIAIIIQKMIAGDVSGVSFTANPVNKNKDEIMIDAVYGLGEQLVQGTVIPHNFIIDKQTLSIKSQTKPDEKEILAPVELQKLCTLLLKIEDLYRSPQDIEWTKEGSHYFILQSRPITTL